MNTTNCKVTLCKSNFGKWKNPKTKEFENVDKFTWRTEKRLEISLITFGATLIGIKSPDRTGHCEDILMGFENLEDYLSEKKYKFGSVCGQVCGVIKNGEFCLNGKFHRIGEKHCFDGGENGFNQVSPTAQMDFLELF
jgi:aldose 1-epimerase